MKTLRGNKLEVVFTGELSPSTDCPKAKEYSVYFNGVCVDTFGANTKKYALEKAIENEEFYIECENLK